MGTGLLATTGVLGLGALSSSPSGAVTCLGASGSDGSGNVCTSGANAFSDAGQIQNNSADPLLDVTGSPESVGVDLGEGITLVAPPTPTAMDNGAKAEGTGAFAVAGADQSNNEFVDVTIPGDNNDVSVTEMSTETATGSFSTSGNEATADGTGAVAVAGSNQTNVLSESITATGSNNTATLSLGLSNTFVGNFTGENNLASATGEYAVAVAGSNETSITQVAITQSGTGGTELLNGTDIGSAIDNVTTDDDTAIADGNFAAAYAGSGNTSTTGGTVTADDDTAIAEGTEASAAAGSGNTSSGDVTENDDTAIAVGADGGNASSAADGNGVTVITIAFGPSAVAAGTGISATTSAGAGSFAVALSSTGEFSISFNGTTI